MYEPTLALNVPPSAPPQRTAVVFGHYRGGTSMVAGLLRVLGVPMGEKLEGGNNEDQDFQNASARRVIELIEQRNRGHDVWGWKYPGLFANAAHFYRRLRNPYFVVILRDVLACAQGEVWRGALRDPYAALKLKHAQQTQMLGFVDQAVRDRLPVLVVSYERSLMNPSRLVDSLARFLGLAPTSEVRRAAIATIQPERGNGDPFAGPAPREHLAADMERAAMA